MGGEEKKKERREENQNKFLPVLSWNPILLSSVACFFYLILFLQWKQQIKKFWLEEIAISKEIARISKSIEIY